MAIVADLGNDPNKKKEQDDASQQAAPSGGSAQVAPVGGAATNFNAVNAAPKPQGSGQFTNLNKFLDANKNAGTQIGGAIQTGVNQDLAGQQRQANTQADAFKQGALKGAQGNLQQGVGFLGNVGGDISAYQPAAPAPAPAQTQAPMPIQQPAMGIVAGDQQTQGRWGSLQTPAAPQSNIVAGDQQADRFGKPLDYQGMMDLVANKDQFDKFTGLRSGTTQQADAASLAAGAQNTAQAAATANQRLAERQNQLGSETNRFGLLGEFLGNKTYNQGARTLDQAFLQKDKQNTLSKLQQNLQDKKNNEFAGLTKQATDLGATATDVQTKQQDIMNALSGQTAKNSDTMIGDIDSQVDEVNKQRDAERQQYKDYLDIMKGTKQGNIGSDVWEDFGMKDNQSVLDTFKNINDVGEIADISDMQAQDYKNIATQRDADIYGALAKLQGVDNSRLNTDVIAQNKLTDAAQAKTDMNSVQARIAGAYNSMLDRAKGTELTGTGVESYDDGWGSSGESRDYTSANMGELLSNAGIDLNKRLDTAQFQPDASGKSKFGSGRSPIDPMGLTEGVDPMSAYNMTKDDTLNRSIAGLINPANTMNNPIGDVKDAMGQRTVADGIGSLISSSNQPQHLADYVNRGIGKFLGTDKSAGAMGAAKTKSVEDLQRQIAAWQQEQGLSNVATRSGVSTTPSDTVSTQPTATPKSAPIRSIAEMIAAKRRGQA